MIYKYPQEVHDFVRENCTKLRDDDLAEECNRLFGTEFTKNKMKCFRGNHGYWNGMPLHYSQEEYQRRQTHFPKGMHEYIRDNSWGVSNKEMVRRVKEKFGYEMTVGQMHSYRSRYGFRSGGAGWVSKTQPPPNKGKKIDEYMSPEAVEKVRRTVFKKGDRPVNEMPIGTEIVNELSKGYRMVKVSMTGTQRERWKFVHRLVWEKHHGAVPEDSVIVFRDGDKMNCDIENLALITRGELAVMNRRKYFSDNPLVTDVGITLAKIRKAVSEAEKRRKK